MSKIRLYLLLLVFCIGLTGYSTVEPVILAGTYRKMGTKNFIQVFGNGMHVHISGTDERDGNGAGLEFKYVL